MARLSRRAFLGLAASAAGGAAVGGGIVAGTGPDGVRRDEESVVAFHGAHQPGIVTPAQDRLHFAAFDVVTPSRSELAALLRDWTAAARAMVRGAPIGTGVAGMAEAPPDDTGEAAGLSAGRLTLTVGFGPTLFVGRDGRDRFGLAQRRPAALVDLPAFPGDALDAARCGGDIAVQACADDPQIAVHAVRNLARLARGVAVVRWTQLGFGRTATTSRAQATPRNLFGFKDGTNNLRAEDTDLLATHVWVAPGDERGPREWVAGGSYLVARRISMVIETWDRAPLAEQEAIIGRHKLSGAPLGARAENDPVDLGRLPSDAHVRLAAPANNGGARLLRRGYSFTDGTDGLGHLDAGLFFLAYQRDPRRQFVPLQQRLARQDAMNEYVRHTGSGTWACPPGVRDADDWWGRTLLASA